MLDTTLDKAIDLTQKITNRVVTLKGKIAKYSLTVEEYNNLSEKLAGLLNIPDQPNNNPFATGNSFDEAISFISLNPNENGELASDALSKISTNDNNRRKYISINFKSKKIYEIYLSTSDGSYDTYLTLYDNDRNEIASNDDYEGGTQHSFIPYISTSAGTYFIEIGAYDNNSYGELAEFYVKEIKIPEIELLSGSVINITGNVFETQYELPILKFDTPRYYMYIDFDSDNSDEVPSGLSFNLRDETTIFIEGTPQSTDYNSVTRNYIFNVYDGNNGNIIDKVNITINWNIISSPPATGNSFDEAISFTSLNPNENGELDSDALTRISTNNSNRKKYISINLQAEKTYDIYLSTSDGSYDTYLTLYDNDRNEIAYNDDYDGIQNSFITYTSTSAGTYFIEIGSWNDNSYGELAEFWVKETNAPEFELLSGSVIDITGNAFDTYFMHPILKLNTLRRDFYIECDYNNSDTIPEGISFNLHEENIIFIEGMVQSTDYKFVTSNYVIKAYDYYDNIIAEVNIKINWHIIES